MADQWIGLVNTLREKFVATEDLTQRSRLWLMALERRGRISFNSEGISHDWAVKRAETPVTAYGDGGDVDFNAHNLWSKASLAWRGFLSTDAMTKMQRVQYGSDTAIVNRYAVIMDNIRSSLRHRMGSELYVDGNAAGNELRMHGAASWQGNGTVVAADLVHQPSDTYANLSTLPAQYDTWSSNLSVSPNAQLATDWPEGSGGAGYDYWSPKLVNWSSTSWGSGTNTWIDNCEEVLSRTQQWLYSTAATDNEVLFGLLAGNLFSGFKSAMRARQREVLPHPEDRSYGIGGQSVNFEGMLIKHEFDAIADQGEILNFGKMRLNILTKTLIDSEGPQWAPTRNAWLFSAGIMGNLKFKSPKFFAHLENYA